MTIMTIMIINISSRSDNFGNDIIDSIANYIANSIANYIAITYKYD